MKIMKEEQGIAMTEGVIVVPFFIAVWLGAFSLYGYFTARLVAQGKATDSAYTHTISGNCSDTSGNNDDDAVQLDSAALGIDNKYWESVAEFCPLIPTNINASADVTHTVYGRAQSARGSRVMLCNNRPVDGVFEMLIETAKGWLGV
ncbi:MAG: pilus assembly protein [Deltaproteobacteria bacterium]|nr:pilus assembly protein [Deltaproteobacteria bacterium]